MAVLVINGADSHCFEDMRDNQAKGTQSVFDSVDLVVGSDQFSNGIQESISGVTLGSLNVLEHGIVEVVQELELWRVH